MRVAAIVGGLVFLAVMQAARAQAPDERKGPEKLSIGVLTGAPRPEGFVIEDKRAVEKKAASRVQTWRRPAFSNRGPAAKYLRNYGEAELSIPPLDLLAERLVQRYGEQLKGKKVVVQEFSFAAIEQVNNFSALFVIPMLSPLIGMAMMSSDEGTDILYSMGTSGSVSLQVTVSAEVDGKEFFAMETASLPGENPNAKVAAIVEEFFRYAFYRYERSFGVESENKK